MSNSIPSTQHGSKIQESPATGNSAIARDSDHPATIPTPQPTPEQLEIAQLRKQLEKLQSQASLGELLSTTTHEFNNVLMTIINYAKLGIRHRDDSMRDKSFDKILSAGERAARITNSILAMARNRSDSMEPLSLKRLIEDSLVLLEREMNKYRISVETTIDDVPDVVGNGNQLQQVLLNLLINARQAMPNGGRLLIRLSVDDSSEFVQLQIRDNGKGIPKDALPHIFDAYFSTKTGPDETGKGGTGLGLANCRDIIERHHGRIRVESTMGKGTAFTIRIPPVSTSPPATIPLRAPSDLAEQGT